MLSKGRMFYNRKTWIAEPVVVLLFAYHTILFSRVNDRLFTDKPDNQLQTVQIKINNNYIALIPLKGLFKVPGFQGINYIGEDGRNFSNT